MANPYMVIVIKNRNGAKTIPLTVIDGNLSTICTLKDENGYLYTYNRKKKTLKNEYGDTYKYSIINN